MSGSIRMLNNDDDDDDSFIGWGRRSDLTQLNQENEIVRDVELGERLRLLEAAELLEGL